MDITYIEHSSFAVETENNILVFDCYSENVPEFDNNKNMFVFSSHVHSDHFSMNIFKTFGKYKNVTYILSNDIHRKYGRKYMEKHGVLPEVYEKIVFISANEKVSVNGIEVETLRSNDEGVAFIVKSDGKEIYHSGDLNDWVWQGEREDINKRISMEYKTEIDKIKGRHFDAAFAVVDPRQKEDFYKGAYYLFENVTADIFIPMHFWNDDSVVDKLREHEKSEKFRDKIVSREIYTKKPYKISI